MSLNKAFTQLHLGNQLRHLSSRLQSIFKKDIMLHDQLFAWSIKSPDNNGEWLLAGATGRTTPSATTGNYEFSLHCRDRQHRYKFITTYGRPTREINDRRMQDNCYSYLLRHRRRSPRSIICGNLDRQNPRFHPLLQFL